MQGMIDKDNGLKRKKKKKKKGNERKRFKLSLSPPHGASPPPLPFHQAYHYRHVSRDCVVASKVSIKLGNRFLPLFSSTISDFPSSSSSSLPSSPSSPAPSSKKQMRY
jgi:hypothetical protein